MTHVNIPSPVDIAICRNLSLRRLSYIPEYAGSIARILGDDDVKRFCPYHNESGYVILMHCLLAEGRHSLVDWYNTNYGYYNDYPGRYVIDATNDVPITSSDSPTEYENYPKAAAYLAMYAAEVGRDDLLRTIKDTLRGDISWSYVIMLAPIAAIRKIRDNIQLPDPVHSIWFGYRGDPEIFCLMNRNLSYRYVIHGAIITGNVRFLAWLSDYIDIKAILKRVKISDSDSTALCYGGALLMANGDPVYVATTNEYVTWYGEKVGNHTFDHDAMADMILDDVTWEGSIVLYLIHRDAFRTARKMMSKGHKPYGHISLTESVPSMLLLTSLVNDGYHDGMSVTSIDPGRLPDVYRNRAEYYRWCAIRGIIAIGADITDVCAFINPPPRAISRMIAKSIADVILIAEE